MIDEGGRRVGGGFEYVDPFEKGRFHVWLLQVFNP